MMDFFSTMTSDEWIWPIGAVLAGVVIGYVAEKIVLASLKKAALKTKWQGDEIIIRSFKYVTFLLFVILGLYIAARHTQVIDNYINQVLIIAVVVLATWTLNRIGTGFVALYTNKQDPHAASSSILKHIVQFVILGLGVLIILQSLGISVTPMLTAAGIGGVAIALGLQSTLSNVFTGVQLVASKKIQPGNYIEIQSGERGYVHDITWRYTTIKTLGNNLVIVPNTEMATAVVKNYSQPGSDLTVRVSVGVSYDSDLDHVERVTREVAIEAMKDQNAVKDIDPTIRFHTFNDSSIDLTVAMRTRKFREQYALKHEFIKRLHKRYQAEGIEIPYPIQVVELDKKE